MLRREQTTPLKLGDSSAQVSGSPYAVFCLQISCQVIDIVRAARSRLEVVVAVGLFQSPPHIRQTTRQRGSSRDLANAFAHSLQRYFADLLRSSDVSQAEIRNRFPRPCFSREIPRQPTARGHQLALCSLRTQPCINGKCCPVACISHQQRHDSLGGAATLLLVC